MTGYLIAQGVLIAIILLQMWQNYTLVRNLRAASLNGLHLSCRLTHALSIARVFMGYLSKAEDTDRACMTLTEGAVKDMHRSYFYAMNGQPMTEDA